ncbi:MAG: hypothetical protein ACFFEV_04235 [Candidatus Thorarchaeota archaeon]
MQKTNLKVLLGISIVTTILFAQVANVAAANNQGLEWGIHVGDRFDYDFQMSVHNSTFDLELTGEMYIVVNLVHSISDDIEALMNFATPSLALESFVTYWSNGTLMDDLWTSIRFMATPFIAYPTGNWSLITHLFEDAAPTAVIAQDTSILNYTVEDSPTTDDVISYILQKSNGVATSTFWNVTWGETTIHLETTLTSSTTATTSTTTTSGTTGTTSENGDSSLILMLGGGTAVVIVVIAIVFMRRK